MCAGFSLCNLVGHPSLNASVDRCRGKSGSGEGGSGESHKAVDDFKKIISFVCNTGRISI